MSESQKRKMLADLEVEINALLKRNHILMERFLYCDAADCGRFNNEMSKCDKKLAELEAKREELLSKIGDSK